MHSQAELASALENLDIVLMQFNQPEGEIQIQMPPDLNRRVKSLQEACPELLEAGDQWPTKIEETLATWIDLKGDIEKLSSWIATAESEFGSIQNIPKFLMDFNALEDRFQVSMQLACTIIVNAYFSFWKSTLILHSYCLS